MIDFNFPILFICRGPPPPLPPSPRCLPTIGGFRFPVLQAVRKHNGLTFVVEVKGGLPLAVQWDDRIANCSLSTSLPHWTQLLASTLYGLDLASCACRCGGVAWGDDDLALLYESWWDTRRSVVYTFPPSRPEEEKKVLFDRSTSRGTFLQGGGSPSASLGAHNL